MPTRARTFRPARRAVATLTAAALTSTTLLAALPAAASTTSPAASHDLVASWVSLPAGDINAGDEVVGYFAFNVNDVPEGLDGTDEVVVYVNPTGGAVVSIPDICQDGSSIDDGVLTCVVPEAALGSAYRAEFTVRATGDGSASQMSAVVSMPDSDPLSVPLPPIGVNEAQAAVDVVVDPSFGVSGVTNTAFTLTMDMALAVPTSVSTQLVAGPVEFDLIFDNVTGNPGWRNVVELTRAREVSSNANNVPYPQLGDVPDVRWTPITGGYHVVVSGFNPAASAPRTDATGATIQGNFRYFANFALDLSSIYTGAYTALPGSSDTTYRLGAHVTNVRATTVSGAAITSDYRTTNNSVSGVVTASGSFSNSWQRDGDNGVWDAGAATHFGWPAYTSAGQWDATFGQGNEWDATPHVASGRWVVSKGARVPTSGQAGWYCRSIGQDAPLAGPMRTAIKNVATKATDLWVEVTTQPVDRGLPWCGTTSRPTGGTNGGASSVSPPVTYTWLRLDPTQAYGPVQGNGQSFFYWDLSTLGIDPATVTGIRVHTAVDQAQLSAINEVRAATPNDDIWTTGSYSTNGGVAWQTDATAITATAGKEFPATTHARDVLWGVPFFPSVTKKASDAYPEYGETVTFDVTATAETDTARGGPSATDLVLVDEIPAGLTYVEGSASVAPDSVVHGTDCPSTVVVETDCTVLTWTFADVDYNVVNGVTYAATADWQVGRRTNVAYVSNLADLGFDMKVWTPSLANGARAEATVERKLTGSTSLEKDVKYTVTTVDAPNEWTLRLNNNDYVDQQQTDVIDELPYNADHKGTSYHGTYAIVGEPTTSDGATVMWTDAAPGSFPLDPTDTVNGGFHTPSSIWKDWSSTPPADPEAITGLRFLSTTPLPAGQTATYTVGFQPVGSQPGDTYENYAWAEVTSNGLRMINAAISSVEAGPTTLQIDKSPGVYDPGTQTLTWKITARNSGENDAADVTVTDTLGPLLERVQWSDLDKGTAASNIWTVGRLAAGEQVTATVTALVDRDAAAGQTVLNTVTVQSPLNPVPQGASDPNDTVDADDDQWDQVPFLFPDPSVELVKDTDVTSIAGPGADVGYTFTVTNTGNLNLTDVVVTDLHVTDIVCDKTALARGESMTCTGTWTDIPAVELGDGTADNTATVTGTWTWPNGDGTDDEGQVTDEDWVAVPLGAGPAPTIAKKAELSADGSTVTYTVTASNPAWGLWPEPVTDDLSDVLDDATLVADAAGTVFTVTSTFDPDWVLGAPKPTVSIPLGADAVGPDKVVTFADGLPAGETVTATYTVQIHGTGNRTLHNVATVLADPDEDDPPGDGPFVADTELDLTAPAIGLVKTQSLWSTDGQPTVPQPGAMVTYQVDVTNTGQTPYAGALVDVLTDVLDDATLVASADGTVFTVTTTTDGAPVGNPVRFGAGDVVDDVLTYADGVPALSTVTLTFTVTITASGNGTLFNLAAAPNDPGLDPKTFADPDDDGKDDANGSPMDTVELDTAPGLVIDKSAEATELNGVAGTNPGDEITWTFTVTNMGTQPLTDVTVEDPTVGAVTLDRTTLAPGESATGTVTRTVTEDDMAGTEVVNTAYATAADPADNPVRSDDDTARLPLDDPPATTPSDPALELTKRQSVGGTPVADSAPAQVGDVVTYQVEVTNTGGRSYVGPLTDVLTDVLDDADLVVPADDLAFQAVMTVDGQVVDGWAFTPEDVVDGVLVFRGDVPPGATVTLTYQVLVTGAGDGHLVNVAAAPFDGADPRTLADPDGDGRDDSNGSPMHTVELVLPQPEVTPAALDLVKYQSVNGTPTGTPGLVRPGDVVTYRIDVANRGGTDHAGPLVDVLAGVLDDADLVPDASGTVFTVTTLRSGVPVGTPATFTAADVRGGVLGYADGVPAGATVRLTYDVVVTDKGDHRLVNVAAAPVDGADPRGFTDKDGDGKDDASGSPMGRVELDTRAPVPPVDPAKPEETPTLSGGGATPTGYHPTIARLPHTGADLTAGVWAGVLIAAGMLLLTPRLRRRTRRRGRHLAPRKA